MTRIPLQVWPASREDVEWRLLARVPYVLVSIRDGGSPVPMLRPSPLRRDTLYLEFDDAEPPTSGVWPPDVKPMTAEHAHAVWAFVRRHLPDVGAVVVHCEQGVRRSPAVAAALLLGLGLDAADIFEEFTPNRHVTRLMLEACGVAQPSASVADRSHNLAKRSSTRDVFGVRLRPRPTRVRSIQ